MRCDFLRFWYEISPETWKRMCGKWAGKCQNVSPRKWKKSPNFINLFFLVGSPVSTSKFHFKGWTKWVILGEMRVDGRRMSPFLLLSQKWLYKRLPRRRLRNSFSHTRRNERFRECSSESPPFHLRKERLPSNIATVSYLHHQSRNDRAHVEQNAS